MASLRELDIVRQELDRAVEQVARFQRLHQALLKAEIFHAASDSERDRQRLLVIGPQHNMRHLVGQLVEQAIAVRARELAVAHRSTECNLEVDLNVGRVDAGRIVDGIGVEAHAMERRLDAAALRHAEVGALAHHLAAQVGTRDTHRIVGAVAYCIIGLGGSAHIGTDAAEEQQVDRHFQDSADQLGRREAGARDVERPLSFG